MSTKIASIAVLSIVLLCATNAEPQHRRTPPPTPFQRPQPGPQAGGPGRGRAAGPCEFRDAQPSIALTLEPAVVYPGDRVTLRWQVHYRIFRPGQEWGSDISLTSAPAIDPPLPRNPVGNSGSHVFIAPAEGIRGAITLATWCGTESVRYHVETGPELRSVVPERGAPGKVVFLNGDGFGDRQEESRVVLERGDQTLAMAVRRWAPGVIEAVVPDQAGEGAATIRVSKAGRLDSERRSFRVLGARIITNATIQGAAALLGLGDVTIRLHDGENASTVTVSDALRASGAPDGAFTVPDMYRAVGDSFLTFASVVLTAGTSAKRVHYWVNDVRSQSIAASLEGGDLVLRVAFESAGKEVKGALEACHGFGASCSWYDSYAPDADLNNATVVVRATLAARNGAIRVDSLRATFDAQVALGSQFEESLARALTEYSDRRVKEQVQDGLNTALGTQAVRRAIEDTLANQLTQLGVGRIISLAPVAGGLRIEYE